MNPSVELSLQQFSAAWRILCSAATGHSGYADDGVEYQFSGVPLPFFNAAILTGEGISAQALQDCARRAVDWASPTRVPWILVATLETMEPGTDCVSTLDECGFAPLMPLTGMLAQHVGSAERYPDGLELRVPEDDAGCTAILDVNSEAYGMPFAAGEDVWGRQEFWKDHVAVVGFAGGKPVSTTVVLNADGYLYVALVATAPGQQRRGYADAVMRHALERSRQKYGELPTFLHASDAGSPVYTRMGYQAVSRHMIFMEKRYLGGH